MARLKLSLVLLVVLLAVSACGGGASSEPTAASGGASSAPTAASSGSTNAQATSAPAPTQAAAPADQPTAASAPAAGELQVDTSKLSKELHIYNWADYLNPEVLKSFEQEYGVKVTMEVYDNNEDMIAKIRPGNSGYDVVFPSDYAVEIMARDKLIATLDKSLLPNLAHLRKSNLDLYYDKGNVYSIPYNYGTTGLAYNKSKFSAPVDSWGAVFDPKQVEPYKGEVSMLDDEREVPGAALHYLGKSMNDTDPANLKQAEDLLKAQKPFLAAYDSSNVSRKLAAGEIVIGQIYNNNAMQARTGIDGDYSGNADIVFVVPKEGGTIWQDNACIVADSPNIYTAHVFLNYLMRPEIAAKNTAFNQGITPNADAEKLLDPKIQQLYKEGFAPDDATMKRLEWIVKNEKTVAFTDLWTAVKGE
ncbi:MAG TPA: spermidine/putrescine ABC transporter substrate-binding protein [Kouleothrix sp.]|uniref:ABC transporter substrate-binding protein n=1 Tax=Kouleothrix sp. TaxID=2779161 RepID=UPI002BEB53C6|nr:spermidine/putrescine ABC transporter substrate-binding protein [Kouleothrix sp.]